MSVTEEKEQPAKVSGKVSVGHPVDVATGTLTHDFEDHVLPGRMALIFARRYSSQMPLHADSVFGAGWSSPFQMYLEDGVAATHEAWRKGHEQGIAIQSNGFFEVPIGRDVGLAGGQNGLAANHPLLNGVRIILQPGTNKLITAYPIYIPTS